MGRSLSIIGPASSSSGAEYPLVLLGSERAVKGTRGQLQQLVRLGPCLAPENKPLGQLGSFFPYLSLPILLVSADHGLSRGAVRAGLHGIDG